MKPVRSTGLNQTPQAIRKMAEQNAKVLGGNVSFGSTTSNSDVDRNIVCWKATGTTPATPNTSFVVPHNLGRIPIGVLPVSVNQPGAVIRVVSSTSTTITLDCNVASVGYAVLVI